MLFENNLSYLISICFIYCIILRIFFMTSLQRGFLIFAEPLCNYPSVFGWWFIWMCLFNDVDKLKHFSHSGHLIFLVPV